jgi:hypothetical protein
MIQGPSQKQGLIEAPSRKRSMDSGIGISQSAASSAGSTQGVLRMRVAMLRPQAVSS